MAQPDSFHFFSWATFVSLDLPVGFEEKSTDPDRAQVVYHDDPDDDTRSPAVVVVKVVRLPPQLTDAWRRSADALVTLPGRRETQRREGQVEGFPATLLTSQQDQPDLGRALLRHELLLQADDLLFTLSGACALEDADEYRPAFERAFETARFILPTDGFARAAGDVTSVVHEGLRLSLHAPARWTARATEDGALRIEDGDASTWMRFSHVKTDGFDGAAFEQHAAEEFERRAAGLRSHRRRDPQRATLSSLHAPVVVMSDEWVSEAGEQRAGLLAFVRAHRYLVFLIEAEFPPGAPQPAVSTLLSMRVLDAR